MTEPASGQECRVLSAEEFIKIWKGDYRDDPNYVEFYKNINSQINVVFDSCKVIEKTRTNRITELCNIQISNSEIEEIVIDPSAIINTFEIDTHSQIKKLTLYGKINKVEVSSLISMLTISGKVSYLNILQSKNVEAIVISGEIGKININYSRIGKINIADRGTIGDICITESEVNICGINGVIGNFIIETNSTLKYLPILGKTKDFYISGFIETITLNGEAIAKDFNFKENSIFGNIFVRENARVNNIHIYKNAKGNDFVFDENVSLNFFYIEGEINNIVLRQNTTAGNIELSDNAKTKGIHLSGNVTTGKITVAKGGRLDKLVIVGTSKTKDIDLYGKLDVLSIKGAAINTINIQNCEIASIILEYIASNCKQLNILGSSVIGRLYLLLNNPLQVTINASQKDNQALPVQHQPKIHIIDLKNVIYPKDAYLNISDIWINTINIDSFLNHGTIVFNNIKPISKYGTSVVDRSEQVYDEYSVVRKEFNKKHSTLRLVNSDLGNMQFIDCKLAGFDEFIFKNTKMRDVFIADSTLPDKNKISSETEDEVSELEQKRLALSQFKRIYEQQGDVVKATEYRAEELDVYRELLKKSKVKGAREWWNRWGELLNLRINKISNYYGNNWIRAIILTLAINWVLFTAYCLGLGYNLDLDGGQTFWKLFSYSFEFLNPLHKSDFFEDVHPDINNVSRIIDYLSRIVIAYMVYQTVQAFRKFGRKS